MKIRKEWKPLALMLGGFMIAYWLPVEPGIQKHPLLSALALVRWYAREHVLLCLIPAFFIAGAISVFVSHEAVLKYLGARAKKVVAYGVASVSGSVLAVCSCTVLPLFAGIYKRGAGLGPATAFLYAGPAINVLALVLTARVLGWQLGAARVVGAVAFSIIIGLGMHFVFRKEEAKKADDQLGMPVPAPARPLWKNVLVLAAMICVLVFVNWAASGQLQFGVACCPSPDALQIDTVSGVKTAEDNSFVYVDTGSNDIVKVEKELIRWQQGEGRWFRFAAAGAALLALAVMLASWFRREELGEWTGSTWGFAKQIMPLLFAGVLVAGLLLDSPGGKGLIPASWVAGLLGGNSLRANLFASMFGSLMYFATLTEVPIVGGLMKAGMGQGPALALLLAGPALSLPSILVIRSIMGTRKTIVYLLLVVVMATISGMIFGAVLE
jgi:uncharacterized membrane protein YraQ (UPF0718 family)